jgi:hypothetical protein
LQPIEKAGFAAALLLHTIATDHSNLRLSIGGALAIGAKQISNPGI